MKAIVWTKYGPPEVLYLAEIEKPVPKDDEVLIKVCAATVTAGDCEARSLKFPFVLRILMRCLLGFWKPKKILGQELSGIVESVGTNVSKFKKGDEVFAATLMQFGAYAEYACLPETHPMAIKPANITFEEAATIPTGGINGLHFLRVAGIHDASKHQAKPHILIVGAGGSIGTYALQIARSLDVQVTCVDSTGKIEMLRVAGANHVIDYTWEDFTKAGERFDVIIDVVCKTSLLKSIKALKPRGHYVAGNPGLSSLFHALWIRMNSRKKVSFAFADYRLEDVTYLKALIEAGALKPVIDKVYPIDQAAEAHRYVEAGNKKGNVVLKMEAVAE